MCHFLFSYFSFKLPLIIIISSLNLIIFFVFYYYFLLFLCFFLCFVFLFVLNNFELLSYDERTTGEVVTGTLVSKFNNRCQGVSVSLLLSFFPRNRKKLNSEKRAHPHNRREGERGGGKRGERFMEEMIIIIIITTGEK